MSATDELRRLLDERGVRHSDGFPYTTWLSSEGLWTAYENAGDDTLMLSPFKPEQAIEATLGRGECKDAAGKQMAFFSCSACGATTERKHPRFCFACGRKVVDE